MNTLRIAELVYTLLPQKLAYESTCQTQFGDGTTLNVHFDPVLQNVVYNATVAQ